MQELKFEIEKYIEKDIDTEWKVFSSQLSVHTASKREIIFRQTDICDRVIYILEGIAASEYNQEDKFIISRFFQPGNLCSNMISAVSKDFCKSDNVIAITNMKYVAMPFDYFMNLYIYSDKIGIFLRKKILEHLIEAKNIISIKTSSVTEVQYSFMEENYPETIAKYAFKIYSSFYWYYP